MGVTLQVEESDFTGVIEDGDIFTAKVLGVKLKEKPYTDEETGQKVKKIEFKFKITDEESQHLDREIWGETGTRFNIHLNCKLRNWAIAILGKNELPVGYTLDTDDLVDHDCRIEIGLREYEKEGKTQQHNFVKDVYPSRAAMSRMAAEGDEEPF